MIAEDVIAQGVADDGVRWTLRGGGDDESYMTMLRISDALGVIDSGGMGGAKLWGSELLNVYTGRNPDRGPQGVVVRCDPLIERLDVVYQDGTEVELVPCGVRDGLRFGVLLVAAEARLREVVGTGRDRGVIARFDLRGHDASMPRYRRE